MIAEENCFDCWKISLKISIDEELPIHFKQSSARSKLDNNRNFIKEKKEIGHSNFGSSHQWCSGCCLWICGFYVGSSLPNLKLVVVKNHITNAAETKTTVARC